MSPITASTKAIVFSSSGLDDAGLDTDVSGAVLPPPPTRENRFTPVSQEPTSNTSMPPMPRGIPNPPPADRPRTSSTLLPFPAVHRMFFTKQPSGHVGPSARRVLKAADP